MITNIEACVFDRDGLTSTFANTKTASWETIPIAKALDLEIPSFGAILGVWSAGKGDQLADLMVVRDDDYSDMLAWLSAYFSALSPVTQWCRVLPYSTAQLLNTAPLAPALGGSLGSWIGAILAECSAQSHHSANLKELPGAAAMSSATFAAGRAVALWGAGADIAQIAIRHDDVSSGLREGARPIEARQLLPVWNVLTMGSPFTDTGKDKQALQPFASILERIKSLSEAGASDVVGVVSHATDYFDLPELVSCGRGPQMQRVAALDKLAERLRSGPRTPVIDALLGLGASLIDPGAAVLPDLLKRFEKVMPTAPVWLGMFAGAWSPSRVLNDHQGLGRLIAKTLLARHDLLSKPDCDIGYEELTRWLGNSQEARLQLRGMAARTINVELSLGVTCPFQSSRAEGSRDSGIAGLASRGRDAAVSENRGRGTADHSSSKIFAIVEDLSQRVQRLESYLASFDPDQFIESEGSASTDLLGNIDPPSEASIRAKRPASKQRWRK